MLEFKAAITIKAPPAAVWAVLADLPRWPEWDPSCEAIEGRLISHGALTVRSKLSPKRPFRLSVSELNAGHKMVWTGGMPLGLFTGVRTFVLTSPESGVTRFTIKEELSGPLLFMVKGSLPDLDRVFKQFCDGLKKRCEGGSQ